MKNRGIYNRLIRKDIEKGIYYAINGVKCANCGHTMLLGIKGRRICSWCGHYIFKNKRQEFEYRLKEAMR